MFCFGWLVGFYVEFWVGFFCLFGGFCCCFLVWFVCCWEFFVWFPFWFCFSFCVFGSFKYSTESIQASVRELPYTEELFHSVVHSLFAALFQSNFDSLIASLSFSYPPPPCQSHQAIPHPIRPWHFSLQSYPCQLCPLFCT